MASIISRHAGRAVQRSFWTRFTRPIHSTALVLKKKAAKSDVFLDDDLFDSSPVATKTSAVKESLSKASASTTKKQASRVRRMEPEEREQLFKKWLAQVQQRVGRHPEIEQAPRKTLFNILLSLATTREQVVEVVDLIPKFIASKRHLSSSFSEAFARRCQELQCPDLALKVFGSYPVYNAKLTLPAARWLLHSLYLKHPFTDVLLAANMYSIYNLSPINEDLVSASLMTAACYKQKTPESLKIAEALIPHITQMLAQVDLSQAPNPVIAREQKWAAWALRRANLMRGARDGQVISMDKLPLKVKLPTYKPTPQAA